MKLIGKIDDLRQEFPSRETLITIRTSALPEELENLKDAELDIDVKKHRKKRSLDANAMLWACLGDIAKAIRSDSWSVYLYMLELYGEYEYILVRPEAVEKLKKLWRTVKVVGESDGMTEVLCFFGSSTYNSKQFSRLLDGVVSEMREMSIPVPPSEDMKAIIEDMRKHDQTEGQQ